MKRLPLIAVLLAVALPAPAQASAIKHAVVVSVTDGGWQVQVVGPGHTVQAVRFQVMRGRARRPARLGRIAAGSIISYRQLGGSITGVRVTGHLHTVSYYASVIRASRRRLVVRLADGCALRIARSRLRLSSKRRRGTAVLAHAASAATVARRRPALRAGTTVLVTESLVRRGVTRFSVTLPPLSGAASPQADTGRQFAQG